MEQYIKSGEDTDILSDKVTLLINSCDAYSDLWMPFFTLLKKYWSPMNLRIVLNTETIDYSFEGLNIDCVHPEHAEDPYGKRMLNVLSNIETPYVIPLLDDFFLRSKVDFGKIGKIVKWMDEDNDIVYFNCDCTNVYEDWELDKYPGYRRMPYGCTYMLNMQAAVWRTEKLKLYWKPKVSPWDWEEYCNALTVYRPKDKFYCATSMDSGFCDYGFKLSGMGVHYKKWVISDVGPLFKKENINIDFSIRGEFVRPEHDSSESKWRESLVRRKSKSDIISRCLTKKDCLKYFIFIKRNNTLQTLRCLPEEYYIKLLLLRARKKFYKEKKWDARKNYIKTKGIKAILSKIIGRE